MLVSKWVLYLIFGKIIIHIWQSFHFPKFMQKFEWLNKLHECDLCSGVWVYTLLSMFLGVELLSVTLFTYIPVVAEAITGIIVSWLVHLFSLGWKSKYEITVI